MLSFRRVSQLTRIFRSSFQEQIKSKYLSTMVDENIKVVCNNVIKSEHDKREYRALELKNEMRILLISDPTTDKSSAAMDVGIGHMMDPEDIPGLAHFCEHMLFLGTEKYPSENEYSKFLQEHAGSSNAFTAAEHTNFYFDVDSEHLGGSLDRFSQFFKCPLFTQSATEREVEAINSEHEKNINNDTWRLSMVEKATAKRGHPFSKFGTGTRHTLWTLPRERGLDVRDALLKYHAQYYSANIMSLAILGKESLDELCQMVVPLFADVVNKNVQPPVFPESPYGQQECGLELCIMPIKDIKSLMLRWPIPDLHLYYKSSPGHYLGHLIGHEGVGSLLSEIKKRGWGNALVGGESEGAKGFMFFSVKMDVSDQGLANVDEVVKLIYQYLNMLRYNKVQEWIYNECRDLAILNFKFKDKESPRGYTSSCAHNMRDYPLDEILSGGYVVSEFRPDLIKMVLDHLTVERARVTIINQQRAENADLVEPWYGTRYKVSTIDPDRRKLWSEAGIHDNLALPQPNEFIPHNFSLCTLEEGANDVGPQLLRESPLSRVWYKQDPVFRLPKLFVSIDISSPYCYIDPMHANMGTLFVALFEDELAEYSYEAELAGLKYALGASIYGLQLMFRGYHDKLHVLLEKVLERLVTFEANINRFEIWKEKYARSIRNFQHEPPHQHAVYYMSMLTAEQVWSKEELVQALEETTFDNLKLFVEQLLSRIYLEVLIYGNVTKDKADNLVEKMESILQKGGCKPLPLSQRKRFREIMLPDGCNYVLRGQNTGTKSSALENYYQCGMQSTHTNMLLELLVQTVNESFFNTLRTVEQLGYLVYLGVKRASGVQGLRVIIQTEKPVEYVESRVEAFLYSVGKYLEDLSEADVRKNIIALAARRLEKPKRLRVQNNRYWSEIMSQYYSFNRDEEEVACLQTFNKEDLINFYKENIAVYGIKRRKLCVLVVPQPANPQNMDSLDNVVTNVASLSVDSMDSLDGLPKLPEPIVIENINAFKQSLCLYPLPQPCIKLLPQKAKL